jgi:hypothetical protein
MAALIRAHSGRAVSFSVLLLAATLAVADDGPRKSPVPAQGEQDQAANRIRTRYAKRFEAATNAPAKTELAKQLLDDANDEHDGKPAYYVQLRMARDMAIDSGDVESAIAAIEMADQAFAVDANAMRIAALETLARAELAGRRASDLVNYALIYADEASAAGAIETARQFMRIAREEASKTDDAKLKERVSSRSKFLEADIARRARNADLRKTIAAKRAEFARANSKDPIASRELGQLECLNDDWDAALPRLADGDEPKWKALAEQESKFPATLDEELALADGWYDLAGGVKGPLHDAILRHAADWYRAALQSLHQKISEPRQRIEKRLAEIETPEFKQAEVLARTDPQSDPDSPFAGRRDANRQIMLLRYGGTRRTEKAVGAALYWLAHHQMREGNWSLMNFQKMCKDKTCTGPAAQESLSAATAFGLLPFLAAGQTHAKPGPFQKTVFGGTYWLMNHQKPDGDLSAGAESQMYSHGLATIAMCESYGMTQDKAVGACAQRAVNFIQAAQNPKSGGWRYHPGEEGDTSVLGWQLMALKSAQMAGLSVDHAVLDRARCWLAAARKGPGAVPGQGRADMVGFAYQPDGAATPTMTAVGLLSSEYLGTSRQDAVVRKAAAYVMSNLPEENARNIYYWYYGTQAMHNMADQDWNIWNRKMREILVKEQEREGCAAGSWSPDLPNRDAWGPNGGRLMMTSLSALTLEVYYRYPVGYRAIDKNPAKSAAAGDK